MYCMKVSIARRTTGILLAQILRLENLDFMAQFAQSPSKPMRVSRRSKFWHRLAMIIAAIAAIIWAITIIIWIAIQLD